MDTINGEWIMKGCRRSDRGCLHSPEDLLELVQKIGFLPLFSNEIPGFSVEEHTPAADWWTDSPETDPWAWRQVLASSPYVAYGKFFDKKAGFVSWEWFPDFANYRRDGYDFEGFCEDGKAKHRNRQIMDAFGLDEQMTGPELLSCDLKKKAAVAKGFEGSLTELQMQSFLIMGDFRRRQNKYGIGYGWHVAAIMTPETKWGYDWVNGSPLKPGESWSKIRDQLKRYFPSVTDHNIQKIAGIRR